MSRTSVPLSPQRREGFTLRPSLFLKLCLGFGLIGLLQTVEGAVGPSTQSCPPKCINRASFIQYKNKDEIKNCPGPFLQFYLFDNNFKQDDTEHGPFFACQSPTDPNEYLPLHRLFDNPDKTANDPLGQYLKQKEAALFAALSNRGQPLSALPSSKPEGTNGDKSPTVSKRFARASTSDEAEGFNVNADSVESGLFGRSQELPHGGNSPEQSQAKGQELTWVTFAHYEPTGSSKPGDLSKKKWLVYTYEHGRPLSAQACNWTASFDEAGGQLQKAGQENYVTGGFQLPEIPIWNACRYEASSKPNGAFNKHLHCLAPNAQTSCWAWHENIYSCKPGEDRIRSATTCLISRKPKE